MRLRVLDIIAVLLLLIFLADTRGPGWFGDATYVLPLVAAILLLLRFVRRY